MLIYVHKKLYKLQRIKSKTPIPKHIIINLSKDKDKEILESREK